MSKKKPTDAPVFCEHANECPTRCPCPSGCYCKSRTCKTRLSSRALAEVAIEASKGPKVETWEDMVARLSRWGWW